MELFKETKDPRVLVFQDSGEVCAYACAHCGKVYSVSSHDLAKKCCLQWSCESCGQDTYKFSTCCRSCLDQRRLDAAEEVEWDGWVYDDSQDKYFENADEAAAWYEEESEELDDRPDYMFICDSTSVENIGFKMSDWVMDHVSDNHHEDAVEQLVDLDELDKFCKEWAKKQKNVVSYFPNYKKKVKMVYGT